MDAEALHHHLTLHGINILAVTSHRTDPHIRIVHLREATGTALGIITGLPDVLTAIESVHTPTVLLVRFHDRRPPTPPP